MQVLNIFKFSDISMVKIMKVICVLKCVYMVVQYLLEFIFIFCFVCIYVLCIYIQNLFVVVKLVMEVVCIMKGIKFEWKFDFLGLGWMVEDYWGLLQKMLGDMKFLELLKVYDKDNILVVIIKKIREKLVEIIFYYQLYDLSL